MTCRLRWCGQNQNPDVEFQYGRRLGEFSGMSSQRQLPHCRVLPPGEFSVMIPELRVTLQGAAAGRIQWHVIPEPCITLQGAATWWIHCHDFRATCHIAGCKNSIRHIENCFSPHFIFAFLMQFRLWLAVAFVSSLIQLLCTPLRRQTDRQTRLKWKIRRERTVGQLWACGSLSVFVKCDVWERRISIIGGAGTVFSCVHWHSNHWAWSREAGA